MTGEARFWLYKLALETGLRAGELRSLTRASFDLAKAPTVTIDAASAKNRESATLPLRSDTADGLRTFLANKLPTARVFALPRPEKVVILLRGDLAAAGLKYKDAAGRVVDFHSLRKAFASLLLASGVDVRTAKELMRHSSITLTADVYAVTMRGSLTDAVSRLPSFALPAAQANGTDGSAVASGANAPICAGGQTGGNGAPNGASRFAHVRETRAADPLRIAGKSSAKRDETLGNSIGAARGERIPPREVESLSSG
ncbi:MAG: site-specific integrase [Planctomycetes bacterium]|nr:site-specific integrase [Planctomycetota bacterium]